MIFKRKSFRLFRGIADERITEEKLGEIERAYRGFTPLSSETRRAGRMKK